MARWTCPTCGRSLEAAPSAAPPFCSARCRLVDLHRWLTEQYSLPTERDEPPDDDAARTDGNHV